ncbi:hypothetical protein [Parafrankia discariae]|uniref:hypothetical protein n=1 Tax=Parafrankia discariae TaxID=365528 RepID=UPI00037897D1|nr:hypothetical protein [Parafrankia discariae]
MTSARAGTFAALLTAALAGHELADHLLGQTDAQAAGKATSWAALGRHVGQYHAVLAAVVGVTVRVTRLPVSGRGLAAGLAVSAATHALFDRRWPVCWLMTHTGSPAYAAMTIPTHPDGIPYTPGQAAADSALHVACLWAAALAATALSHPEPEPTKGA